MYIYYVIISVKCNSKKFCRNSKSAATFYFVGQREMESEMILTTMVTLHHLSKWENFSYCEKGLFTHRFHTHLSIASGGWTQTNVMIHSNYICFIYICELVQTKDPKQDRDLIVSFEQFLGFPWSLRSVYFTWSI